MQPAPRWARRVVKERAMDDEVKKVLAETWEVSGGAITVGGASVWGKHCDDSDVEQARARLAACAPEMARLLLLREWTTLVDEDGEQFVGCGTCSVVRVQRVGYAPEPGAHHEACGWLALMQKAGIR